MSVSEVHFQDGFFTPVVRWDSIFQSRTPQYHHSNCLKGFQRLALDMKTTSQPQSLGQTKKKTCPTFPTILHKKKICDSVEGQNSNSNTEDEVTARHPPEQHPQ